MYFIVKPVGDRPRAHRVGVIFPAERWEQMLVQFVISPLALAATFPHPAGMTLLTL